MEMLHGGDATKMEVTPGSAEDQHCARCELHARITGVLRGVAGHGSSGAADAHRWRMRSQGQ